MTIVACDKTDCDYNREAEGDEREIARRVCRKEYIVVKECDDFEPKGDK